MLKLYEKIGEGGFGKVVRGFERYDNPEDGTSVWEQVAVKIFNKSSLNYKISFYNEKGQPILGTALESIYNEIKIQGTLTDDNICKVLTLYDNPDLDKMFLSMQYCDLG